MTKHKRILSTDCLTNKCIQDLIDDKIAVVRVKDYGSADAMGKLKSYIQTQFVNFMNYQYAKFTESSIEYINTGVKRFGIPYNITYTSQKEASANKQNYYLNAQANMEHIRTLFSPYLSPFDKLRLQLDEVWSYGSSIANFQGAKNFAGILRAILATEFAAQGQQFHVDSLPSKIENLSCQLSANIYIQCSVSGGELVIKDIPPYSQLDVELEELDKKIQTIDCDELVLTPLENELILFNTRKPHSIKGFPEGIRSSIQCFIGANKNTPLQIWS